MKVNTTVIFSIIWLIFLIFFLIMGYQSCLSINTELPRYHFEAPTNATITIAGQNMPEAIETLDKIVSKIEKSIVSEAKTMTAINFASAFLCFLGLFAQITDNLYKNTKGKHKSQNHSNCIVDKE